MSRFSIEEILTLDGAVLHGHVPDGFLYGVSTDSRHLVADQDLYLALKGERFDGHNFVAKAFENGACLAIVNQDSLSTVLSSLPAACASSLPIVSVPNSLTAYQGLARLYLRRVNPLVVAITGSSGKTTTKEMAAAAFSAVRVHKSPANENNEIGVPKTVLAMPEDTEVAIIEMGMRGLGQIAELAACATPDIAIITCAGSSHIELLGSRENIARAKSELLAALDPEGLALIGEGSEHLLIEAAKVYSGRLETCPQLNIINVDSAGTTFTIPECPQEFFVRAHGKFLLEDAWCAIAAARASKLDNLTDDKIAQGLSGFAPVEGRGNAAQTAQGTTIVDESYNANPDSMRCAVEAILSHAYPQSQKIVVLGAMAELGDFTRNLHIDLGRWLKNKPLTMLVTVGPIAGDIAGGAEGAAYEIAAVADQDEALARINNHLKADTCIMIKGSHSTNLDRLVHKILR